MNQPNCSTKPVFSPQSAAYVFMSRPNNSLTRIQGRMVFWSLVGLSFGAALVFAAQGYWLVLPFAGLEMGVLAWAFEALQQRRHDFESLTIDQDRVVVAWRQGEQQGRREFNRLWAQLECVCRAPGRDCHVYVRSQGSDTELGRFLDDAARMELAQGLRGRLGQN